MGVGKQKTFCIQLENGHVYCGEKNKMLIFLFAFGFRFFTFHSNVIHREIRIKDFSGITVPRILKSEKKTLSMS